MSFSKLDVIYRKLILTKFYTRGWGKPEELKDLFAMHKMISKRESCLKMVASDYPVHVDKTFQGKQCTIVHGHFVTPMMNFFPNLVPPAAKIARFEMILPENKKFFQAVSNNDLVPACIHMAGTGDHGFQRRREVLAKPLLKTGIASVLLENPFYGKRKPKEQWKSGLLHVSDLFVMGGCLVVEALVLMHWLKRHGYGPLGLTGVSMGGHMASLAATNWPEPVALIPCMSWASASVVWTEGVLSKAIPWPILETQYAKNPMYEQEIMKLLGLVDSYKLGKEFISEPSDNNTFKSQSVPHLNKESKFTNQHSKKEAEEYRRKETINFMKGVMDEITHLGNYSRPVDTSLVTFVVAKNDAYFPRSTLSNMQSIWPNCEVREINCGHVLGFVVYNHVFVKAIVDTFSRLLKSSEIDVKKDPSSASNLDVSTNLLKKLKDYQIKQAGVPLFTFLKSFLTNA